MAVLDSIRGYLVIKKTNAQNTSIDEERKIFKNDHLSSLLKLFTSTNEVTNTIVYIYIPVSSANNGAIIKVGGGSLGCIL